MNDDTYLVNYDKIVSDKKLLSSTRLLAASIVAEPYTTVQNYLQGLSDRDLEILMDIAEDQYKDEFSELVLVSEMLAQAEGLDPGNIELCTKRTNTLIGFLACESLARKGLVRIHRHNMSFGEEYGSKIIVERLDDAA